MTVYIIKFSDNEDKILTEEELKELAILWDGEVTKHGDILTEYYPEDFDDGDYFPVSAYWEVYYGDYSTVERWEIPVPTHEEYLAAVLSGECGEAAQKGLLHEQATWEMVQFVPAHSKYEETWSHSRESSDGYRSGGRDTVSRGYVHVPDTWIWVSSTGMRQELPTEAHRPQFKTKYSYEWYCSELKSAALDAYNKRRYAWETTNTVTIKKPAATDKKPVATKPKHPLSKKSGYPELKKYFYGLYPELQEYEEYIFLCMWPDPHAIFRIDGIVSEQLATNCSEYLYKFDFEQKKDVVLPPVEQLLSRAKAFKTFADEEAAKRLAAKEEAAKLQQQQQLYEAYRKAQQAKKAIIKSFDKWVLTIA